MTKPLLRRLFLAALFVCAVAPALVGTAGCESDANDEVEIDGMN